MKIIVGLGNPGTKYQHTRHNAGFLAIDYFLQDKHSITCQSKFEAQICEFHQDGNKILFIKPQTFMNNSGQVVQEISAFYKINSATDLLVIHDDKDLAFGVLKFTNNSSAAGHNGIIDIIAYLNSQNFARIRIGIESRAPDSPLPTEVFVLQNFTEEELNLLNTQTFITVNQLISDFINNKTFC